MDDDEKALALMPLWADRMEYHRRRLQAIGFHQGSDGVAAYKAKFPEAAQVQLHRSCVASVNKPKGYDAALCKLVDTWFISDAALNESNRATVERLNNAMAPRRFDPNRHFSIPLSAGRLKQLAAVFAANGAHLDTSKAMSMSLVRSAVKVAKGKQSSGRPFGKVGHITGSKLIIGSQSFTIMQHHGHDCIKITLDDKRLWLRLDVAAAFIASAGLVSGDGGAGNNPEYLLSVAMRERVPDAENGVPDPLSVTVDVNSHGESVPDAPLSLTERMAAKRSAQLAAALQENRPAEQAHSTTNISDTDADPLAFTDTSDI